MEHNDKGTRYWNSECIEGISMSKTAYKQYSDPCYLFRSIPIFLLFFHALQIDSDLFCLCSYRVPLSLYTCVFHSLSLDVVFPYECHSMLFHSDISFGRCSALVPFPHSQLSPAPQLEKSHNALLSCIYVEECECKWKREHSVEEGGTWTAQHLRSIEVYEEGGREAVECWVAEL